MIVCGHYVLIKDVEKIHNSILRKGVVCGVVEYGRVQCGDHVHFNGDGMIKIPGEDVVAVKYTEIIFRDEREEDLNNNHLSFTGMGMKF